MHGQGSGAFVQEEIAEDEKVEKLSRQLPVISQSWTLQLTLHVGTTHTSPGCDSRNCCPSAANPHWYLLHKTAELSNSWRVTIIESLHVWLQPVFLGSRFLECVFHWSVTLKYFEHTLQVPPGLCCLQRCQWWEWELKAVQGGMPQEDWKAAGRYPNQINCWKKCLGRFAFVDWYELGRRDSTRSNEVSVLNPNNGRRKTPRCDYEAEMNSISIFKNMNNLIFLNFTAFGGRKGLYSSQCFFFCCCCYDTDQLQRHYLSWVRYHIKKVVVNLSALTGMCSN